MFDSPTVVNLCFHGIGEPDREREAGEAAYWISEGQYLQTLDQVVGRDDVRLSFDDGNHSDLEIGLPALLERGLVAEFFLLAGRLDQPGSLSRTDVRLLQQAGMRIGSHGMHHRSWREVGGADIDAELGVARTLIEEAGDVKVDTAACPLGLYDRRVLGELRRRGYRRVMTSDRAVARPDAWLQPRFSLRAMDDRDSVQRILDDVPTVTSRLGSRARVLVKSLR
jgi:peptidoglycan/xylan/chitin deacetylase (PgdA/CDA1 family)